MADKCPLGEDCDLTLAYMMGAEKAKDTIVVLKRENERLRAALEEIDSISVHSGGDIHGIHPSFWEVAFKQAQDVTRAALSASQPAQKAPAP
jgi:gamma-glutamyl-gamma-aminobutyrate hydrolase PuuD